MIHAERQVRAGGRRLVLALALVLSFTGAVLATPISAGSSGAVSPGGGPSLADGPETGPASDVDIGGALDDCMSSYMRASANCKALHCDVYWFWTSCSPLYFACNLKAGEVLTACLEHTAG